MLSLAFGVGQVVIGAAMIAYAARKGRWRQITLFGLALLGAWFAASGVTELVVSGAELLSRLGGSISATAAAQIRASADAAFLDTSLVLLAAGAGYLLLARYWTRQRQPAEANASEPERDSADKVSSAGPLPPAEASSAPSEPDG